MPEATTGVLIGATIGGLIAGQLLGMIVARGLSQNPEPETDAG